VETILFLEAVAGLVAAGILVRTFVRRPADRALLRPFALLMVGLTLTYASAVVAILSEWVGLAVPDGLRDLQRRALAHAVVVAGLWWLAWRLRADGQRA
jgi:hypothetical protein